MRNITEEKIKAFEDSALLGIIVLPPGNAFLYGTERDWVFFSGE